MSRIGRLPIAIPAGVDVKLNGQQVEVKGPKGTLNHTVAEPIKVGRNEAGEIEVTRPDDERLSRSLHGLTRTLVSNMVTGVTAGYEKKLEIVGVGYQAQLKGKAVNLQVGYTLGIYDVKYKDGYAIDNNKAGKTDAELLADPSKQTEANGYYKDGWRFGSYLNSAVEVGFAF